MGNPQAIDGNVIWKRLGLEELRLALTRVIAFAEEFEGALRALPPCDSCARAALLDKIEASGRELGGAAISVSTLAEVLRCAQAAAESAQVELERCRPETCACPAGRCTCGHALRQSA